MRYFVINLEKRKDCWKAMTNELKKQNLVDKTTRFCAIERDWDSVPLERVSDEFLWKMMEGDKYFTPGAVGAYESHMQLWELCLKENEPIVIFEDDIQFTCNDFETELNRAIHEIESTQIDMITFFPNIAVKNIIRKNEFSIQTSYPVFGAYGYYITPLFIEKVKDHMSILHRPFDVQLKNYCQKISSSIHCILTFPYLITTPTDYNRDSNIVSKKIRRNLMNIQNVNKIKDCEELRQKNTPFLYLHPNCTFKFNMMSLSWYNPLNHFVLKDKNGRIVLELFRNNKTKPVVWCV